MGGLNLVPYTVTATGTITTNDTRISGFTVINTSATNNVGVNFNNLNSDGSVGDTKITIDFLNSVGGNGNQITQNYTGTGVYFENGVYCSVDTSCRTLFTTF